MINYGFGIWLDAICLDDIELMRTWRNDPKVRSWCRQTGLIEDVTQVDWFEAYRLDKSQSLFLLRTNDKIAIGVGGLTSIDNVSRRAEFSMYIAPDHQRRGHGERALRSIFNYGFKELNLNCIWGETFAGNPALTMFLNMGMKIDGIRRQFYFKNGAYIDATLISLLKEEACTLLS